MTTAIPAFNDTINPLGRLKPPGNYDELVTDSVTDALPGVLGVANDFVVWASRQLGHEINPVKWLSEAVGGDWGVLLSLADVWNNLAWANNDIGTNLTRGLTELNPYWNGNAAQAFDAHMEKWWGAFEENEALCANVRDTLKELAKVAKEFLQAAIDLIEMLASILGGGGLVALVFKWWDIGQGAINSYRVYNALTKNHPGRRVHLRDDRRGPSGQGAGHQGERPVHPVRRTERARNDVAMAIPDGGRAERMRELVAEFRESVAEVHRAAEEASASTRKLASTDFMASPEYQRLEREVAESFRSGRSGDAAQTLQEKVDRGDLTWQQIREGTADPEATRLYQENQAALIDEIMRVKEAIEDADTEAEPEAAQPLDYYDEDDEPPMPILKKRSPPRRGEN